MLAYVATYRPAYMEGAVSYLAFDVAAAYPELFPDADTDPHAARRAIRELKKEGLIVQERYPEIFGSSWRIG